MTEPSPPSEVYARLLLPKRHGYPLFIAEPDDNLPLEYRTKGTSIGDVGIITPDGSFDFVFNICVSDNDPVNCYGVPDGFEQVTLDPEDISLLSNMHPPGSDVSSASVKKTNITVEGSQKENELLHMPAGVSAGYSFTSTSSEAAILALPEGAGRQNLRNLTKFRRHAIQNTLRWYQFVNSTLGREAPNGSLYLVTGCDKSTTWGIASVSGASGSSALSLKATAAQIAEARVSYSYSWETHCPATVRVGPDPCGNLDRLPNQCVFLRGFKMTVREGPMAALMGAAKLSSIVGSKPGDILSGSNGNRPPFMNDGKRFWSGKGSSGGGSAGGHQRSHSPPTPSGSIDEDVILEFIPGTIEAYHPLNAINKHLLASMPDAQVAVTHEIDWWILCDNDKSLPTDEELIGRLQSRYRTSMESGGIFLIPKNSEQPDHHASGSEAQSPMHQSPARFDGVNGPPNETHTRLLLPRRHGYPLEINDNFCFEYRAKVRNISEGRQTSHEPPNHLDQVVSSKHKTSVVPSNPMARTGVLGSNPLPSPRNPSSNRLGTARTQGSCVIQLPRHPLQKAYNNSIMGEWGTVIQLNLMRSLNTILQAAQGNADHASYPNTTTVTTNPECQSLDLKTLNDLSGTSPPLQGWQPAERPILEHDSHYARGDFSNVWKGLWKDTGNSEVAVKVLRTNKEIENGHEKKDKRLRRELLGLDHPNILLPWGTMFDTGPGNHMSAVHPWLESSNINGYLERQAVPAQSDRFRILYEVAAGVSYLHSRDVVHGDLTGSDILIDHAGKAVLAEFDRSTMVNSNNAQRLLEIHHGPSIPGTFPNMCISTSPLGDSAIKELRAVSTDLHFVNGMISVFENQLRPIWSVLSHENIVPLRGIYTNNGPLPIIEVPYYRNGCILDYNVGATSSQIAAGLSYLHEKGFHHGNICPTNIMIKAGGRVCIADPAVNMLMRRLTYDPYVPTSATWHYKPREELLHDTTGPEADGYSWASVIYEMFCGRQPYHGYYHSRGIVKIISHGHRTLDKPPEISPELWSILQKCWMLNPAARPSMPEVELELHELE